MKRRTHLTLDDVRLPLAESHFVLEYLKDFDIHRTAVVCGLTPEEAFDLRIRPDVLTEVVRLQQDTLTVKEITADWLSQELYELLNMCKQTGKLTTAHQVLKTIGSLGRVDAYAAEKVELKSDRDVVERLMRGRSRVVKFDLPKSKDEGPNFI